MKVVSKLSIAETHNFLKKLAEEADVAFQPGISASEVVVPASFLDEDCKGRLGERQVTLRYFLKTGNIVIYAPEVQIERMGEIVEIRLAAYEQQLRSGERRAASHEQPKQESYWTKQISEINAPEEMKLAIAKLAAYVNISFAKFPDERKKLCKYLSQEFNVEIGKDWYQIMMLHRQEQQSKRRSSGSSAGKDDKDDPDDEEFEVIRECF